MPATGNPELVDALYIMTFLLARLCRQVKAPRSAQAEKPQVPTTSEPFRCSVRVVAAVTECEQTKEAMVDDIPSFLPPWTLSGKTPLKFFLFETAVKT